MKANQLKRLQKLEEQIRDDCSDFYLASEYETDQRPDIITARKELKDYIIRHGPEPPRFYQYRENEFIRRFLWAMRVDKKAQALYKRITDISIREAGIRGAQREKAAKEKLINEWERELVELERIAKETAEREGRQND